MHASSCMMTPPQFPPSTISLTEVILIIMGKMENLRETERKRKKERKLLKGLQVAMGDHDRPVRLAVP